MAVLAKLLFVVSLAVSAEAKMPNDFLKVESEAWSRWLDEDINVFWHGIPLKDVLAGEFGTAAIVVDNAKDLKTSVTFNADGVTRRVALWRLTQRYRLALHWAQKDEPRVFLGLLETEKRKRSIGGNLITTMTHAMRSEYETYQKLKLAGRVTHEEKVDGTIYYSVDIHRHLPFKNGSCALFFVVERYKTNIPKQKVRKRLKRP